MLAAVQEYAWRAVLSADGTGVAVGACCDGLLAGGGSVRAGRARCPKNADFQTSNRAPHYLLVCGELDVETAVNRWRSTHLTC